MGTGNASLEEVVGEEAGDDEPLLGGKERGEVSLAVAPDGGEAGRFTFRAGTRPWRDVVFAYLFVATVAVTYGFGLVAIRNAEPDPDALLRFTRYNPSSGRCEPLKHAYVGNTPTHVALSHGRRDAEEAASGVGVGAILAPIVTTAVAILPLGLAALWLLHRYTREVVLAIFGFMLAVPVTFAVGISGVCLSSPTVCSLDGITSMSMPALNTVALLGVTSLIVPLQLAMVCKRRSRIDLAVQILKTALQALKQNLSLLVLSPALSLAGAAVTAPGFLFVYYALLNGDVAPNFEAIRDPSRHCSQATGAPCCQFQLAPWVAPYLIVACVALLWTLLVAHQLQILVISGTVSQWYFAPTGSSTVGTTKQSIRNAFGASFGTACLASLMIAVSKFLKGLMDRAGANLGHGIVVVFLQACFAWLLRIFEFFTRFTTNFAAISGDGFCASAHATFGLLKRNLLSTVVVEVMVQSVLSGITLMISLVVSFSVFGAMYFFTAIAPWYILVTANVCFWISLMGLAQLYGAVSTVVDTVYICYAMDKDVGAVSKRDVHDVYMLLPPVSSSDETRLAVRRSEP